MHSCCLHTPREDLGRCQGMPGGPTPTAHGQGTLARLCMGEGWVGAVLLLSRQPWCSRLPIACRHRRSRESVALPCRHTHIRAANACYLLCFGGGVALAYIADVVEQLTASDQANIEAAMQLALNQTLRVDVEGRG